ncbi:MAG TPA: formate/nitrite transporter family protein [Acidobacteriaceae bacterium]|nr:formate/nitrite transporter family protein [Acidobacteriaceae bacterium]
MPWSKRRQPAQDPSVQIDLERPSAHQIFEQVSRNARQELHRSASELAVSGLAGGMTMGLTALGSAIALTHLGDSLVATFLSNLVYPLGFIAVIVGRAQLFTENTLYPVALVLSERRHVGATLRLWSIVFAANVCGAFLFALIASKTGALDAANVASLAHLGVRAAAYAAGHIFWSGVFGGWIIALVAWLVSGSHSVSGSVMLIYLLTFLVGAGGFAHCIATSGEVISAVLTGQAPVFAYPRWLFFAATGNICGGVLLVTLFEYGQVQETVDAQKP